MNSERLLHSGTTGISIDIRADGGHRSTAAELERLGYDALWIPGGQLDRLDRIMELLAATGAVQVATGIVPLGVYAPAQVAGTHVELARRHPGRFVLGVGGPQASRSIPMLEQQFDELDAVGVMAADRLLAALGPRKIDLARRRAAGAITLLVTPEFTAHVRSELGAGVLVVDEFVVLDPDADRARAAVRERLSFLVTVRGYREAFLRMGFSDEDVDRLSDRLMDGVSAWGDLEAITQRLAAQRAAGADHVVLTVLPTERSPSPLDAAALLADVLALCP